MTAADCIPKDSVVDEDRAKTKEKAVTGEDVAESAADEEPEGPGTTKRTTSGTTSEKTTGKLQESQKHDSLEPWEQETQGQEPQGPQMLGLQICFNTYSGSKGGMGGRGSVCLDRLVRCFTSNKFWGRPKTSRKNYITYLEKVERIAGERDGWISLLHLLPP